MTLLAIKITLVMVSILTGFFAILCVWGLPKFARIFMIGAITVICSFMAVNLARSDDLYYQRAASAIRYIAAERDALAVTWACRAVLPHGDAIYLIHRRAATVSFQAVGEESADELVALFEEVFAHPNFREAAKQADMTILSCRDKMRATSQNAAELLSQVIP